MDLSYDSALEVFRGIVFEIYVVFILRGFEGFITYLEIIFIGDGIFKIIRVIRFLGFFIVVIDLFY